MKKDTSMFLAVIVLTALLKLSNVKPIANWDWLWLLSPLWITVGLGVIISAFRGKLPKS